MFLSVHSKQMGKMWKHCQFSFSWAPKSMQMVTEATQLKTKNKTKQTNKKNTPSSWKKSYDQPRQHIKKQRHYFANGPSSQSYGFFSSHVWMWELDYSEIWAPKNWCFWTVVLGKTLKSPSDWTELMIFPVVMYGCESWTIKKAKRQRTDAFELRCWRRLWRVPLTARSSNQSILKKINPEYSLDGPMLKLKL